MGSSTPGPDRRPAGDYCLGLYGARDYLVEHGVPQRIEDLSRYPLVYFIDSMRVHVRQGGAHQGLSKVTAVEGGPQGIPEQQVVEQILLTESAGMVTGASYAAGPRQSGTRRRAGAEPVLSSSVRNSAPG
ncbi:hypothetical protein GCM10027089_03700 [Nocardia thraciensis]